MYCSQCGNRLDQSTGICPNCGLQHAMPDSDNDTAKENTSYHQEPQAEQQYHYQQNTNSIPDYQNYSNVTTAQPTYRIPYQYKPLGAWTYFWLTVLYSLPLIGLIFLIVHSFDDSNYNRRNFARSFWCAVIIVIILIAAFLLFEVALAVISAVFFSGYAAPMPI